MSEDAWKVIAIVCSLGIGFMVGIATERALWRNDCETMDAHMSYMKVYDCKLRNP